MEADSDTQQRERAPLDIGGRDRFTLGPVGITAVIAAVAALVITIALALIIPNIVERHLLKSAANSIHTTVHEIATSIRPKDSLTEEDLALLQTQVERSLLGREIVRVKIWNSSGTIVFSDEERLIGESFEMSDEVLAAFSGELIYEVPELTRPENQYDRGLGELREYYVPVDTGTQGVEIVFEVYELSDNLLEVVDNIRSAIWIAIGIGSGVIFVTLTGAAATNVRAERRRRARSRRLINQLLETREDERTRIVGALHDDIGQPLYRILYGLQASRTMVEPGSEVDKELLGLDILVREIDATLRSELIALRDEPGVEIDLESALAELVEVTEGNTHLEIDFTSDVGTELPLPHRATLYRAAKEALTNVHRHAHADHVTVRLVEGRDSTMIEVIDDGAGTMGSPGLGLTTTRDRLEAIGGGIDVTDAKGGGTRFVAWVPVEHLVDE